MGFITYESLSVYLYCGTAALCLHLLSSVSLYPTQPDTVRNHMPNQYSLWIPVGYILLGYELWKQGKLTKDGLVPVGGIILKFTMVQTSTSYFIFRERVVWGEFWHDLIKRNILTLLGRDAQSFSMKTGYFYHWIEHYTVVGIVGRYAATVSSAALLLVWLGGAGNSL